MKVSLTLVAIAIAGVVIGSGCGSSCSGPVDGMEFVKIPEGAFQMGSPGSELDREDNEDQRFVTVESFELMTTEVTQGMWKEVMGSTVIEMRRRSDNDAGYRGVGDDYPMYYVSWNDCKEFIYKLNTMDSRYTYRLPTEAEWEYAARAGTNTAYYWGNTMSGSYCWYEDNSNSRTHTVGSKLPNAWGLYDMSGNVWEWCEDLFTSNYDNCPTDGSAYAGMEMSLPTLSDDPLRVVRGGGWYGDARYCRSADRRSNSPDDRGSGLGFRVARSVR